VESCESTAVSCGGAAAKTALGAHGGRRVGDVWSLLAPCRTPTTVVCAAARHVRPPPPPTADSVARAVGRALVTVGSPRPHTMYAAPPVLFASCAVTVSTRRLRSRFRRRRCRKWAWECSRTGGGAADNGTSPSHRWLRFMPELRFPASGWPELHRAGSISGAGSAGRAAIHG
jgi:hypothetical protein